MLTTTEKLGVMIGSKWSLSSERLDTSMIEIGESRKFHDLILYSSRYIQFFFFFSPIFGFWDQKASHCVIDVKFGMVFCLI